MPVIITKEGTDFYLVPSPLLSFSRSTFNNVGRAGFGAEYSATLEGTLVPHLGNPYFSGDAALLSEDSWTKPSTAGSSSSDEPNFGYDPDNLLAATLRKEEKIRSLFSNNSVSGVSQPIMVNITNWGETTSGLRFAAFVDEVSFGSDGRGVNPQSYTISLRTSNFLESSNGDFDANSNEFTPEYHVASISETFDIAELDEVNVNFNGEGVNAALDSTSKMYSVSRSISVGGSPVYDSDGSYVSGLAPWQQASGYVYTTLGLGSGKLPDSRFNIPLSTSGYKTANSSIAESTDKEAGTYSITESYTLYSGEPVIHTINVDTEANNSEKISVSVNGVIQGLNTLDSFANTKNNFLNASGFNALINNGFNVGINDATYVIPSAYYYAKTLGELDWLNPRPNSKSLSRDVAGGTIAYAYSFDDKMPNLVSGSLIETITVNDTYPGELFSATPVIGRNQPVLQYLNSRSEYKRALSINVTMGKPENNWSYNDASGGYWAGATQGNIQQWLLHDKPSRITIPSGDLENIFQAVNPVNDPSFTVRGGKCFHSPPTENWDAFSRSYSYSIEWTYEREV